MNQTIAALLFLCLSGACANPSQSAQELPSMPEPVGLSSEPQMAPTQWKERLEVLYVYKDFQGDYRLLNSFMQELLSDAQAAGIRPSGAPFGLFFDDPANTPTAELRSRLCIPVADVPSKGNLGYDVLPRSLVVYSTVRGAYSELPRVYPTLFEFMRQKGWAAAGPIREIYLTSPGSVESYDQLVAEIQIPWKPTR